MNENFVDETIPKALGLAYTNSNTEQLPDSIELGQIHNFSQNLHVINKIVGQYNIQQQAAFDAMTEEKRKELDVNIALQILSYEQYLYFIKLAKTTVKELRSLYRQQALIIEPCSIDTEGLQHYKNLERRIELAKDTSSPNGIGEAARLIQMGIDPKDPQNIRNIKQFYAPIKKENQTTSKRELI